MDSVTLEMLSMLPSWMKMRKDPENSTGAKTLNAIGIQLHDIENLIGNILAAHHLEMPYYPEGFDITQVDILYKIEIYTETLTRDATVIGYLNGVPYELVPASTLYDFYKSDGSKYYIDSEANTIYTKAKIDSLSVNGALYTEVIEHHVWGAFDEIGLLLGCPRIPGERNYEYTCQDCHETFKGKPIDICPTCDSSNLKEHGYRARLLDVFQNPGNSTRQGLLNYISRSLGIEKDKIEINELSEDFVKSLINPDGTIKDELKEYIILSNKVNLSSSNVYWDILEENKAGLHYLPIIWNVSLDKWNNSEIQNGIGDLDDLEIIGPEQESAIQEFTYYVGVEGLRVARERVYPEHHFKYRVYATGQKYNDSEYKPENYRYTVVASELIPLKFKVKAHKHYTHNYNLTFDGTVVNYTTVTSNDLKQNNYITKNVVIIPGSRVINPDNRYIEILANLKTDDKSVTPVIDKISLNYKVAGVPKTIVIDTQSSISQNGNTVTAGFSSNTWNDQNPILRIRNDTNDNYNIVVTEDGYVTLARGEYQKLYVSEGDWDDGEMINLRITTNGTLKLSI